MAVTETNTKSSLHLRSNNLPSTPHRLISQFEDNLQRLKSSEATSPLPVSSVCNKLNSIQDLHDCIDNLLQLPIEQQALAQEWNEKCNDDMLKLELLTNRYTFSLLTNRYTLKKCPGNQKKLNIFFKCTGKNRNSNNFYNYTN
jgi:hypothetical protein